MNYQENVAAWNSFIKEKGISKGYGQFPTLLYVKFGHEPAPLMFWRKWQITLILGTNWGVMWGIMMHFFTWRQQYMSVGLEIGSVVVAGLLFGYCMSLVMKHQVKKLGVDSWEKFISEYASRTKSAS